MKREKRLTKREKKSQDPTHRAGPNFKGGGQQHIHCIACGRHIEPDELSATPASAATIVCDHGSRFVACVGCMEQAQALVDEHDRTGQAVRAASAWH
jgi:hypothetical protein